VAQVLAGVDTMVAPDLVNAEVVLSIRWRERNRQISTERTSRAIDDLEAAPLQRLPTTGMLQAIWDLRHNVAPRDACYVVTARALHVPLLTPDPRLARAPKLGIPVITV
jgi:predicted nucleic acid-binding protein